MGVWHCVFHIKQRAKGKLEFQALRTANWKLSSIVHLNHRVYVMQKKPGDQFHTTYMVGEFQARKLSLKHFPKPVKVVGLWQRQSQTVSACFPFNLGLWTPTESNHHFRKAHSREFQDGKNWYENYRTYIDVFTYWKLWIQKFCELCFR